MTLAMRDAENIEKGRQEGKQEMAVNMFKSNISIEIIAMAAGTTTDIVKTWLQSAGLLQRV